MQLKRLFLVTSVLCLGLLAGSSLTGCRRSSGEFWEDSKSAGRHMSRGLRTMGGKHGDSRAVQYREEFMPMEDNDYFSNNQFIEDFVPLSDQSPGDQIAMADYVSRQPRETPGDPGSSVPSIDAFQDPSANAAWSKTFRNIHFGYDSNLVKGQENLEIIHSAANHLRTHPNLYVFVEGHCDERGPEAYNLALGARRSNAVRNMLIQEGANPNQVFTISYGKERPLMYGHNEESWSQNRRAEFKIYQQ